MLKSTAGKSCELESGISCESQDRFNEAVRGLDAEFYRAWDKTVVAGPFKGMLLSDKAAWNDGNSCLKLIGAYEHELHAAIEKAISRSPATVINSGCAEGYYAVGLALRLPATVVHAIDPSVDSLSLCRAAAQSNGVWSRVHTHGGLEDDACFTSRAPCLAIIDNEGCEEQFIADIDIEHSDIIVECHDFTSAGTTERITEKLSATHDIERIEPKPPLFHLHQCIPGVPMIMRMMIITEKRPLDCRWLACWSKLY